MIKKASLNGYDNVTVQHSKKIKETAYQKSVLKGKYWRVRRKMKQRGK
jgi:hypothetical protein